MLKRVTLLAISVTALFAIAASAALAEGPLITNTKGEAAETITATSSNTTMETVVAKTECATVNLHLNIAENVNTTARGSGTGAGEGTPKAIPATHTGHCGLSFIGIAEVTNITVHSFHLTRHGAETTGTIALSYTYDLRMGTNEPLHSQCTFFGEVPVKITGANKIKVEGKLLKAFHSTALCPPEGTLKGEFALFDETGAAVTIH